MSEVTLRNWVRSLVIGAGGFYQRHEDVLTKGIPDISFAIPLEGFGHVPSGWIEAKYLDSFPARAATPVDYGLTPEQRVWLRLRDRIAGDALLLLGVGREVLIYRGCRLPHAQSTASDLLRASIWLSLIHI